MLTPLNILTIQIMFYVIIIFPFSYLFHNLFQRKCLHMPIYIYTYILEGDREEARETIVVSGIYIQIIIFFMNTFFIMYM